MPHIIKKARDKKVVLETSASFWKLIEKRRAQPTISLKKLKESLKAR